MCWILIDWRIVNSSPLDKTDADTQTTVSRAFSWMKSFSFQSFFPRVQLLIRQHWFRELLSAGQVPRHFLNHCCPSSPPHICSTRGRWVNTVDCKIILFRSKCVKSYLIIPPFADGVKHFIYPTSNTPTAMGFVLTGFDLHSIIVVFEATIRWDLQEYGLKPPQSWLSIISSDSLRQRKRLN